MPFHHHFIFLYMLPLKWQNKRKILFFSKGLLSFTIPKGVQRGNEVELSDKTYDGERLVG